ncbi:MAG: ABC-F family ATP-binding cassette domain-containing protein, partial [Clostridiales bacterium]|nr:ABC-F family ATP-binding cassette domain-containing protein [Clostridiales bacterium]
MVLACQNVSKSFGTEEILKQVSFHIEDREKAAIVGINGAGKSTLLKIIMGEMSADDGQVTFAKNSSLGYIYQQPERSSINNIFYEMLEVKKDFIVTDK